MKKGARCLLGWSPWCGHTLEGATVRTPFIGSLPVPIQGARCRVGVRPQPGGLPGESGSAGRGGCQPAPCRGRAQPVRGLGGGRLWGRDTSETRRQRGAWLSRWGRVQVLFPTLRGFATQGVLWQPQQRPTPCSGVAETGWETVPASCACLLGPVSEPWTD